MASRRSDKKRKRDLSTALPLGECSSVSGYEKLCKVGEGTYGIVYKARDKSSGKLVALKRCLPHHESSDGFPLTTIREITTLRLCQQTDFIVQLHEVAVSSSRSGVFLVFEYCPHDLANIIDKHYETRKMSPFNEAQVKRLTSQLLSALAHLHGRRIIHRDIKLSNMLYTDSGDLKLADFGLSRNCQVDMTPKVVSLWYRPPELLLGAQVYGFPIDLWGVGCAMAELIKGVPLWCGMTELEQIRMIMETLGSPPASLHSLPVFQDGAVRLTAGIRNKLWDAFDNLQGLSLLSSLLQYDPTERITAESATKSAYFSTHPLPATKMPTFHH